MTIMDFYLNDLEGFTMRPPTTEEGHTKRCMASAMISAVQNARDSEYFTDHEFALWAQRGGALDDAVMYLRDDITDCQCPPRYEEDSHYFVIRTYYKSTNKWETDLVFRNLTDCVRIASDAMEYDHADAATIGYHYDDSRAVPYVWMSLGCGELMTA
jgi:hypothetical protein